jgi:ubiquinol-cytochrome c reductase cytochrome b subunit
VISRIGRWIDDRVGLSKFARSALNHVFPDHWSFLLGEIALYSFVVLVATGVFLAFFFEPSSAPTVYDGSYAPLQGVEMSKAYASAVRTSWDVRAGLVMRQAHHWAALLFLGAIVAHLCRNFFTGAYRRPRELNWIIGMTLFLLALGNGFAGYSMLDDLLSGTGLRIGYSVALSVPIIGTWLAFLLFGGEYPASQIISRLFVLHVMIIPATITLLLTVHLALIWRQKHSQFPGPGRNEDNVVGTRLWPTYAAKSVGLLAAVSAVLFGLGGLVQINPIWLWGPYDPAAVTTAAQPDWYMGWLEGALRLAGPWRVEIGGYTISEVFWPAVLLPAVTFGLLYLWPFIEGWWTRDNRREHQVLQRPRDHPKRTALGVGVLAFYVVLFVAGSQDIIAQKTGASLNVVLITLRVLLFVVPVVVALFTYRMCVDLRAGGGEPYSANPQVNPFPGELEEPAAPIERPRTVWTVVRESATVVTDGVSKALGVVLAVASLISSLWSRRSRVR